MEISEIIKTHFSGSTAKACAALGVSRQAISQWKKGGIPPLRRFQIDAVIKRAGGRAAGK